jgi:hypothetical protein
MAYNLVACNREQIYLMPLKECQECLAQEEEETIGHISLSSQRARSNPLYEGVRGSMLRIISRRTFNEGKRRTKVIPDSLCSIMLVVPKGKCHARGGPGGWSRKVLPSCKRTAY